MKKPHVPSPKTTVTIERMTHQGEGIARTPEGKILFVPGALPQEKVEVRITFEKKDYARGKVLRVLSPAPQRTDPPCPWYEKCGGCQLQHAAYPLQLQLKTAMVRESLQRLGKLEPLEPPQPCVASPKAWGYRNKAAFPVVSKKDRSGALTGFFRERSHDLVRIRKCRIIHPELNTLYVKVSNALDQSPLEGYHEKTHQGFLRHLLLRKTALSTGLTLLVRRPPTKEEEAWILEHLGEPLKALSGEPHLALGIQPEPGNLLFAKEYRHLLGTGTLREELAPWELAFSQDAFFQVNTPQAAQLFASAAETAEAEKPESILELYAGVGALTAFLAPHAKKIEAVEFSPAAVEQGAANMKKLGFSHVSFSEGDAGEFLKTREDAPDMLYLDPPRKGCEPPVLKEILRLRPATIVYVSCNPATLARDLRELCDGGYRFLRYRPFDMFPQTAHVETVAVLERE